MKEKMTTIKVSESILKRIQDLKVYSSETNEGVIYRALNALEKENKNP